MYKIDLSKRVEKFLNKLDSNLRIQIEERIKTLKDNPIPKDTKFIGRDESGEKIFRYRIGDYRALYKVKEKEQVILVAKIDKRSRVYKNL